MKRVYLLFLFTWLSLGLAWAQPCPTSGLTATPNTACPNAPVTVAAPPGFGAYAWNCTGCTPVPTNQGPTAVSWPTPGPKTVSVTVTTNPVNIPQQTFTYAGPSVAIPDNSCTPAIASINVAGYAGNVPSGMSVQITSLTHTFDGDLIILLVAPNGAVVELSSNNGGGGDNFTNTIFNDGAGVNVTAGVAPFTGTFQPEGLTAGPTTLGGCTIAALATRGAGLNSLAGSTANGTWSLVVLDRASGDSGNIVGWNIQFPAQNIPPQVCAPLTQTVNIVNVPTTFAFTANDPLCAGQQLNLVANLIPGATYSWLGPNGFTANVANPSIPVTTTANAGVYQAFASISGCNTPIATRNIVINPIPATPTATATTPVCENDALTLQTPDLGPGTTYIWTGPNGVVDDTSTVNIFGPGLGHAGTYSVTITQNGCTSLPGTTNVVVVPQPAAPAVGYLPPICVGDNIQLTASTIPGASYEWNGPNGYTASVQNPIIPAAQMLNGGSYFVRVVVNGCPSLDAFTDVNIVNFQFVNPPSVFTVCEGIALTMNFDYTVTTAIGPAPVTATWVMPDGTSQLVIPNVDSSFTLSISQAMFANHDGIHALIVQAGDCQTFYQFNVDVTSPIATLSSNTPLCEGQTLQLGATSVPNASYTWDGPNGFFSDVQNPQIVNVSTLNSGTYCVIVTDLISGCTSPFICTDVVVNPLPAAPFVGSNSPICAGEDLTLTAADVPGAVSYHWSGPNNFISNLQNPVIFSATTAATGTYSVFAVTAANCTTSVNTTLVEVRDVPPAITLTSNSPVCQGNDLNLQATQVPNALYIWEGPFNFSTLTASSGVSINTFNVGQSGTYSVIVQLPNGCEAPPATVDVTVFPSIQTQIIAGNNGPICTGESLTLTATPIVGALYSWVGPNGFTSNQQNPVVVNATTAHSGAYVVTVMDVNGCSIQSATTNATVTPVLGPLTIFGNTVYCSGQTINLLATPIPGATYSWFGPNGFVIFNSLSNQTIPFATEANTGTYAVFAERNGCSSPVATIDITVRPAVATPVVSSNTPLCAGQTLSLTASSAGNPTLTTYFWTGPNAFTSNLQSPTIPGAGTENAGTYTVIAMANGCSSQPASTIVEIFPQPLAPQAGSNSPICEGQQLNLTAETLGGVTYLWTGPDNFSSNLQNPVVVTSATTAQAGIYNVVAIVNGQCVSPATSVEVFVNVSEQVTADCANCPVCPGSPATLTGSQVNDIFAFYTWSGPNGYLSFDQNPTIPAVTPLEAGVYTLTVTFSNGCQRTVTVPVTLHAPTLPIATIATFTPEVCAGAPATLVFQVTGRGPWVITYFENGNPQILGFGNSAQVGPLNFSFAFNPLVNTEYVLASIQDGFGCVNNTIGGIATVNVIPAPTVKWMSPPQNICPNQSAVLSLELTGKGPWIINYEANGIAQPQIVFGDANSPSPSLLNLTVSPSVNTTYTLTSVTDGNSCAAINLTNTTVTINVPPTAFLTSSSTLTCAGSVTNIEVILTGRGPWTITYLLGSSLQVATVGSATSPDPAVLAFPVIPDASTTLTLVSVVDGAGCAGLANGTPIAINVLPGLGITATVTSVSCTQPFGVIDAVASGGVQPYIFSINNSLFQPTGTFNTLVPGNYVVTVRDANGCQASTPVLVVEALPTPTNITVTNISATQAVVSWTGIVGVRYTVRYRPAGSTGPFTTIANISQTTTTLNNLLPGTTYEVQVQATCTNGVISPNSPATEFTTLPQVNFCPQPTNLVATPVGNNSISVSWQSGSAATACYDLQYRILPNGSFLSVSSINANSFTITGLIPGASYQVRVRAQCNTCGALAVRSTFTLPVAVTLPSNPCPSNVTLNDAMESINACNTSVILFPNLPTGLPTPITFQWQLNGTNISGATGQFYTATQSGIYNVIINVPNCNATSSQSVVVNIFNLDINLVTNSFFTTCNTCSDGKIEASALTSAQGTFSFEYALSGPVNRPYQSNNTFENLPAGTYTVTTREVTSGCITTKAVTVCNPPTIVSVTNILRNRANINWSTSSCAISYNLRYRPVGSPNWIVISNAGSGTRLLTGLLPNTQYEVQVQALANGGQLSVFSNSQLFQTAAREGNEVLSVDADVQISLYPNPNRGQFALNLETPQAESTIVKIYDVTGKLIQTHEWNTVVGENTLSLNIEANGLYFVEVQGNLVRKTLRVIVQ